MKDIPILFTAEMVRAILEGRKTKTRRLPGLEFVNSYPGSFVGDGAPFGACGYKGLVKSDYFVKNKRDYKKNPGLYHWFLGTQEREINPIPAKCPYGVLGDRLWVRETWRQSSAGGVMYRADEWEDVQADYKPKWKPSIFMPRWASRITLEVVSVRAERLQDITEDDAIAEGAEPSIVGRDLDHLRYRAGYQTLWERINGPDSWDTNPFVWVIEFKHLYKPAEGLLT